MERDLSPHSASLNAITWKMHNSMLESLLELILKQHAEQDRRLDSEFGLVEMLEPDHHQTASSYVRGYLRICMLQASCMMQAAHHMAWSRSQRRTAENCFQNF
eukprot:4839265-Amphidinium_carterae.1